MKITNRFSGLFGSGKMLKILLFCVFVLAFSSAYGQIGLGAEANISYPGLFASDKNNIRFKTGAGYGFFVRHDVYNAENWQAHLRYRAVISRHKANLPFDENSDYKFSNFGLDILIHFNINPRSFIYGGASINLLSAVVKNKFYKDFISEKILPSLLAGWSYRWAEGFDLYLELNSRFGSVEAGPDSESIPVTSIGLNAGITMYISEK